MEIKQNYENYEKVKNSFQHFISTLIWESVECGDDSKEVEIEKAIDKYCKSNADQMIALTNDSVRKFIKSLKSRYEAHLYEVDENGHVIEETEKHLNTDNGVIAFKKAAEFYRNAKCPRVNIFDNELGKYVALWD